jgi:tetratricopeptide (TPR) repeat protein
MGSGALSVFVSHSSKDDSFVSSLRMALASQGIAVWADSQELIGGDLLAPRIEEAIGKATHVLAILSLNAINSPWVSKEIEYALNLKKRVIPVLLPGIEPTALRLWFKEEPVGVKVQVGPGGIGDALPDLLAALGVMLPGEKVKRLQAMLAPMADLVLEVSDPAIGTADGVRRATAIACLTYCPADNGRKVESKRYKFIAPLGPIEADDLTWYLERYINWPNGVFQERARGIEANLPLWGQRLLGTLNIDAARSALEAWKHAPAGVERRFTVKVDRELVEPTPERKAEADEAATLLLALPWELIHDGKGFLFLGAGGVRVRRSLPNRDEQKVVAVAPPIRVLLVSPRPEDESTGYIDHRISARPVIEALTKLGGLAEFKVLDPATFPALVDELKRAEYHVVHFDGHGVYDRKHGLGALCFEKPEGRGLDLVMADKLAETIRGHRVPLFFLEACESAKTATDPSASVAGKLLECGVASVVAMSHSVLVETARRFVSAFYGELMNGQRVGQAMLAGQRALKNDTRRGRSFAGEFHLEDWFVPVLFQEEQDPQLIRELPAEAVREMEERGREVALGDIPPEPEHSFVGRSRELLAAERVLAREKYVVLLGSGGEGKTTMAAELARWLLFTRRFARGAFVALDQAGDRRKVLHAIGNQLMPDFETRAGLGRDFDWLLVERALREQPTVIVIDNMESVLAPPGGSEAAALFEPETLAGILELCGQLKGAGARLIFTSRERLPEPFSRNVLRIGRLEKWEAIRLVGQVLQRPPDGGESEAELEALVDAVGCHARSLVLLAREVGVSGVRSATARVRELMVSMEAKHPGDRERSLLASVELSLRRLPLETRRKIRPLSVFQGGGSLFGICPVLKLGPEAAVSLIRELESVGMAEMGEFGYVRFDPAMMGDLEREEWEAARTAWAEATTAELAFLYEQAAKDAHFVLNLAVLDLGNLLAALEYLSGIASAERIVDFATKLEGLIANLNRPKALARVVAIRAEAAGRMTGWSHAQFDAERAGVERLIEQGRQEEAVRAARSLYRKTQAAGETAYKAAAYDGAVAQLNFGRTLSMSGSAEEAMIHLEEARGRFVQLGDLGMANVALVEEADCLQSLGRYDEAASSYQEAIRVAEELGDTRGVAVGNGQLASVRRDQERYTEALKLYAEARKTFEKLGEPGSVATVWRQIGIVHEHAGQYDAAEAAYQQSLRIGVQLGDRAGEARTLNQLGNLYSKLGRCEEAVRFYRQAAEAFVDRRDLRSEGIARSNVADELVNLGRYDEARVEIVRAIECKKPFGHVALPWTTFAILTDLERATGNEAAARQAREQAIQAYLSYRRAGGASQAGVGDKCSRVLPQLAQLQNRPELRALILALQAVQAGSRDPHLADDPDLEYGAAVELLLLIESLG